MKLWPGKSKETHVYDTRQFMNRKFHRLAVFEDTLTGPLLYSSSSRGSWERGWERLSSHWLMMSTSLLYPIATLYIIRSYHLIISIHFLTNILSYLIASWVALFVPYPYAARKHNTQISKLDSINSRTGTMNSVWGIWRNFLPRSSKGGELSKIYPRLGQALMHRLYQSLKSLSLGHLFTGDIIDSD